MNLHLEKLVLQLFFTFEWNILVYNPREVEQPYSSCQRPSQMYTKRGPTSFRSPKTPLEWFTLQLVTGPNGRLLQGVNRIHQTDEPAEETEATCIGGTADDDVGNEGDCPGRVSRV